MKTSLWKARFAAGMVTLGVLTGTTGLSTITAFAAPSVMSDGGMFDAQYYAKMNPDVVKALGNDPEVLYQHYLKYGKAEGRKPYDPSENTAAVTKTSADTSSSTTAAASAALPDGDYIAMFVPQDVGYTGAQGRALNLAATGSSLIYSGSLSLTGAQGESIPASTYQIPTTGDTKYYEVLSEDGSNTQEVSWQTFNQKISECAQTARQGGEAKAWSVRIVVENGVLVSASLRK